LSGAAAASVKRGAASAWSDEDSDASDDGGDGTAAGDAPAYDGLDAEDACGATAARSQDK
jgi:hypothetical protein